MRTRNLVSLAVTAAATATAALALPAATVAASDLTVQRPAQAEAMPVQAPQAVTLWWVIFNNPGACTFNPGGLEQCGSEDVFGAPFLESIASGSPDPSLIAPNLEAGLAVVHGTGGSTDVRGRLRLVSTIFRTEGPLDLVGPALVDPMGLSRAWDTAGAEVHLVMRTHGDNERGDVNAQVGNFLDPYCSDPNLGWFAGPNLCADLQFAVFGGAESGQDSVYAFVSPTSPVIGSRATLVRNGDAMQAIVETTIRPVE